MNSIIEIVIYIVAILGIIFTYISLKSYEELYSIGSDNDSCRLDFKKVEVVIKTINYNEDEIEELMRVIKNGKFDNLSNIVDNIKIEKYNS